MDRISKQTINIGNQSNDGTGDSIRDAFGKVNTNFDILFPAVGLGSGLRFTSLQDAPNAIAANKVVIGDTAGLTLTQVSVVGGVGIGISLDQASGQLIINNTSPSLALNTITNTVPLFADIDGLSPYGTTGYGGVRFRDPHNDQDLVTQKWVYQNFVNRDGKSVYDTGTSLTSFRANVQILLTATNTTTNIGKTITVFTASGTTSTVDLTKQAVRPADITRKDYVDTKISLQGISTVDPATGQINQGFGHMTGGLKLFRDPVDLDGPLMAATKNYVDTNTYISEQNLYVSLSGSDFQPNIPSYKRGRYWSYAFKTINKAAQYAEQLSAASQIQVGAYAELITHDGGTPCTVKSSVNNYNSSGLTRLTLLAGGNGSDQFGSVKPGQYLIFPGQYIQGTQSKAIALIESIALGNSGDEIYTVNYVDYGTSFTTDLTTSIPDAQKPSRVKFTFKSLNLISIPKFWLGYQFYTDSGITNGTIVDIGEEIGIDGKFYDYFIAEWTSGAPGEGLTLLANDWHVYAGDFIQGETLLWNTNVGNYQCTIQVESGEYYEQYPIKLPANVSIKGDEFRRTIIHPADGISSSKWATTYFRRDTQIDGMQIAPINTSTDYANTTSSITPSAANGISLMVVDSGALAKDYTGYYFVGNGGRGEIISGSTSSFSVNLGENLTNVSSIPAGQWHIYKPLNFGYHYLRDPSRPLNNLTTVENLGSIVNASELLLKNKSFIQAEVIQYITNTYPTLNYDTALCRRDVGLIIDSVTHDLINGGSERSLVAGDKYTTLAVVQGSQLAETSAAISHINIIGQQIINNQTVTPLQTNVTQVKDTSLIAESDASAVLADLINVIVEIVNNNPNFNPGKYNSELDVFLVNDTNVLRLISCQGHGGFMMVFDPTGQIRNKSPYCQTASSFSQSKGKQTFSGGVFSDGFAGNSLAYPTTSTFAIPTKVTVNGLIGRPQVPTFFSYRGIRYEVDFISDFVKSDGTSTYQATLNLNSVNPGGIPNSVTISPLVDGTPSRFKPNQTRIPVTFDQPTAVGGLVAQGYGVTNNIGTLTSIVVTFPGSGYTSAPKVTVGGAVINSLQISSGVITGFNIAYGGSGYAVGTQIEIFPVGSSGINAASASVTSVDSYGAITGYSISNGGSGWQYSTSYRVAYGNSLITVPDPIIGYIDQVPEHFELIMAGNRFHLTADFTQVNDLGYGIFNTNGSGSENVSTYGYYNHRMFYSLNGSQVRSANGSTGYGNYALTAEGSDPNEIPTSVSLAFPLTQIASAYVVPPLFTAKSGATQIYVQIFPANGGYRPLPGSQIEINHYGEVKTYSVGSVAQATDLTNTAVENVYLINFNSSNVTGGSGLGLYNDVTSGTSIVIRSQNEFVLNGLNPATISRPSTALKWNDDPSSVYHITEYSPLQPDGTVYAYSSENFNFIGFTALDQGVTYPKITNHGNSYSTATVTINSSSYIRNVTRSVYGDQGTANGIKYLTLTGTNGIIIGEQVAGGAVLTGTIVTYVNTVTNQIGLSLPTAGAVTSGTNLTFSVVPPVYRTVVQTGTVSSIIIDSPGYGWSSTTTTISLTGDGFNAAVTSPIAIAGVPGSFTIKVSALNALNESRIKVGLVSTPIKYFQFGLGGKIYNITAYRNTLVTQQPWAEIDVDVPLDTAIPYGTLINAGIKSGSGGGVTSKISVLRAQGHSLVDIGTGGYATTRIPNDLYGPPTIAASGEKEVKEINKGRVYFTTTDQDGNFRVGTAFSVNQSKGSVSISAPLDLTNIGAISLRKDLGPAINEFSTDDTMVAVANYKVPTEQAVVNFINRRLGVDQNGSISPLPALGPQFLPLNGILAMTGSINMSGNGITEVATPRSNADSGGTDAVNKNYADGKISLAGTNAVDVDNVRKEAWGEMTGPLQLTKEFPAIKTRSITANVNSASNLLYITNISDITANMQIDGPNIIPGSYVTYVNRDTNYITISTGITAPLSSGTVVTFDPIWQAVPKGYIDANKEFSQLSDVTLNSVADQDLLMFTSTVIPVNTTTNPPIYNTATQIVNVSNNTATITNTATSIGGGSDITIQRSTGTVTFKLVGGQGPNNPITDYSVNDNAAIQQSKLSLQAATTNASAAVSFTQSRLGLSEYNSAVFTTNNGWVDLFTATSISTGVDPSKLTWPSAIKGGLLGSTTSGRVSFLTSGTVQNWLGIGGFGSSGGVINGTIFTQSVIPNQGSSYNIGSSTQTWATVYADNFRGGNVYDNGIRVINAVRGTTNQINTSTINGVVTLSLPQNINTSATVQFGDLTLNSLSAGASPSYVYGTWNLANGASFQATYADLAERYTSPSSYPPGTVVVFGGDEEIVISTQANDRRVAGVITTNPAYLLNASIEGSDVALQGRVPCLVIGPVIKGDLMVTSDLPGVAMANNDARVGTVIGKALENYTGDDIGTIEVAVGRL
jgi:hypothetical protein